MRTRKYGLWVLIFLSNWVWGSWVFAQQTRLFEFRDRAAQYYIGEEDELLIKVNVWGFVRKPGQYLVPSDTDLISLLSFAGGPTEDAKIQNIKLIRTVVKSSDGHKGRRIFIINVKKYLETGDPSLNPKLMPGDTVIIQGSTMHLLSKLLDFASRFTFIAQIYFWIAIARR